MAVYKVTNTQSSLSAVEFTPVADGNFTFFHVNSPENVEGTKTWITSPEVGQKIVAETTVNGHPVLVTHGDKTKDAMMKLVEDRGDKLKLEVHKKPFNFWLWRGALSMTGHPMQLISSFMLVDLFNPTKHPKHRIVTPDQILNIGDKRYVRRDFDTAKGVFAVSNLAANLINMTFGAQRNADTNRLSLLKNEINSNLGEHVGTLEELFKVDDKRAELRKDEALPRSMGGKFYDFMRRNSVTLGEVGLRYFGGVALVFPMKWDNWKKGLAALGGGSPLKAIHAVKNRDPFILGAGLFWLAGKTVAFFAKTPDPYNPDRTTLDKFREEWAFPISTMTEAIGSTTMAYDSFAHRKITYGGKVSTDYLGTVGGLLFSTAFAMRLFAPYGVKEVNMEEVYAHATDTLAKTPPEKLPQLMAETAAYLTEHFKDKKAEFGSIYGQLMADLYKYHHIALDNLGTEPDERTAKIQSSAKTAVEEPKEPVEPVQAKYTLAHPSRRPSDRAPLATNGYIDKALQADTSPAQQIVGA